MKSIAFPHMFSGAKTNVIEGREATMSNMRLLLASWKNSLLGDPGFGTNLKRFIYEQNNIVLQDLIIDDIYVSIQTFLPQIFVKRKDIQVKSDKTKVTASINCINKLDNEVNLYEIDLMTSDNM